jgi:chromosome segregation ATPase
MTQSLRRAERDGPVIKSVELMHFMCHKHLLIEFTKMLTCIGGRNGSGKSAIMIAIGIALGQRAHSLERGNSYKDLIRAGESSAVVRVRLLNTASLSPNFSKTRFSLRRK